MRANVVVGSVSSTAGTGSNGKPYTRYVLKDSNGATYSTFKEDHVKALKPGSKVGIEYEQNGKYKNLSFVSSIPFEDDDAEIAKFTDRIPVEDDTDIEGNLLEEISSREIDYELLDDAIVSVAKTMEQTSKRPNLAPYLDSVKGGFVAMVLKVYELNKSKLNSMRVTQLIHQYRLREGK